MANTITKTAVVTSAAAFAFNAHAQAQDAPHSVPFQVDLTKQHFETNTGLENRLIEFVEAANATM